jgi:hypothetical protein
VRSKANEALNSEQGSSHAIMPHDRTAPDRADPQDAELKTPRKRFAGVISLEDLTHHNFTNDVT